MGGGGFGIFGHVVPAVSTKPYRETATKMKTAERKKKTRKAKSTSCELSKAIGRGKEDKVDVIPAGKQKRIYGRQSKFDSGTVYKSLGYRFYN